MIFHGGSTEWIRGKEIIMRLVMKLNFLKLSFCNRYLIVCLGR